jgi:hypothetical protein
LKRREQYLAITIELNKTIAVHDEVQHENKITNKQIDKIEATLDRTKLLEKISLRMK